MKVNFVFERVEMKYFLSRETYRKILPLIEEHMKPDEFGKTTIQSLYYDTANFRIIRASMDKPYYKEKIRLRAYGLAKETSTVYCELKRKCGEVVYKRRTGMKEPLSYPYLADGAKGREGQIESEIEAFCSFYGRLQPTALLLYDRTAFAEPGSDLRVTFDENIRFRLSDLDLHTSLEGTPLIGDDRVLMEIKTSIAIPLWLCSFLSENAIFKTSFSKYGAVVENHMGNDYLRKES